MMVRVVELPSLWLAGAWAGQVKVLVVFVVVVVAVVVAGVVVVANELSLTFLCQY